MRIQTLTREEFPKIAEEVRSRGTDLAEVLDRAGMLLTPARRAEIESLILEGVAAHLESIPVQQLLPPGVPATPADVQRYMAEAMRNIAKTGRSV